MGEKYPALRYSDNMGGNFKDGVWNIECCSWGEFEDRIEEFKESEYKYVWRGQSCEFELRPSIYRDADSISDSEIKQHLCKFKKDIPGGDALKQFFKRAKKEIVEEFEKALSEYYNGGIRLTQVMHKLCIFLRFIYPGPRSRES